MGTTRVKAKNVHRKCAKLLFFCTLLVVGAAVEPDGCPVCITLPVIRLL